VNAEDDVTHGLVKFTPRRADFVRLIAAAA
jgi:hypothetical protein